MRQSSILSFITTSYDRFNLRSHWWSNQQGVSYFTWCIYTRHSICTSYTVLGSKYQIVLRTSKVSGHAYTSPASLHCLGWNSLSVNVAVQFNISMPISNQRFRCWTHLRCHMQDQPAPLYHIHWRAPVECLGETKSFAFKLSHNVQRRCQDIQFDREKTTVV